MSYCRIGPESDVYVIRSGDRLVCFCARDHGFDCETEQEMIDHLIDHRRSGGVVPERAFDRLYAERDGLPYKTDVQLALETLKIDALGAESPKILLDRPDETA